jgi:hypothetical protein
MELEEALERVRAESPESATGVTVPPWTATEVRGLWILTAPGRSNLQYAVSPDRARAVNPSRERLADVIEEMAPSRAKPPDYYGAWNRDGSPLALARVYGFAHGERTNHVEPSWTESEGVVGSLIGGSDRWDKIDEAEAARLAEVFGVSLDDPPIAQG